MKYEKIKVQYIKDGVLVKQNNISKTWLDNLLRQFKKNAINHLSIEKIK